MSIKPLPLSDWLTPDERAALCIAKLKYIKIPAWAEQAAREAQERANRGEFAPSPDQPPEIAARWERLIPHIMAANDRVRELEGEGRLQAIVESLRAKGVWRDEWDAQEPIGEVGHGKP